MKSIHLMKNVGRFTPPKSRSPIYPQIVCMITPPKLPSLTYPQIICTICPQIIFGDLPPQIAKSDLPLKLPSPIYPQIVCMITPPQNCQVRLTLKSSVQFTLKSSLAIYPPPRNCQVRLTPQIICMIYPQIVFGDLTPPGIAKSDLPSNRLW